MKKFLQKINILITCVLIIMLLLFAFGCFIIGNQHEQDYCASIIDKVERLEAINEPKIILVGNSNLSFGINSKLIEDEIKMPVVNLGFHGGLGNVFNQEISKFNINPGDIVLASYTDFIDDDVIHDAELAWETIEYHFDLWPVIRYKDWINMVEAYPNYLYNSLIYYLNGKGNKDGGSCYARNAFNKYGDIVRRDNISVSYNEYQNMDILVPTINDKFVRNINKYDKYIREKGATLLIIGYPIICNNERKYIEQYDKFTKELKNELNCEVISNYSNYLINYRYFYNGYLHLTEEGANIRTMILIDDIKKWQSKASSNY